MSADGAEYWRRNMVVCLAGSFTTIAAMTLILPFLPIYVEQLGVHGHAAIVQWSGLAYSATFLGAGLVAPLWGRVADLYGRKLILMRACLAMAVCMSLIGLAQNVWQLAGLRLLAGLLGGYSSGAVVLVATQTPRDKAAWALGVLSTGTLAGTLLGPLIGGSLPGLIGVRNTFFLAGGAIFVSFLATCFLIREERPAAPGTRRVTRGAWAAVPDRRPVVAMLATAVLVMLANMSVEPIITVYVGQFVPVDEVVFDSGLVMAAAAVGSILAAPRMGRLADRVGTRRLIVFCMAACGALLLPQAFVTSLWQLILLRFLMGVSLAGLMPCVSATIRHAVPTAVVGTILGYGTSATFAGQVIGPLLGGFVGGHVGMRAVFVVTAAVMIGGAAMNWRLGRPVGHQYVSKPSPSGRGLGEGASRAHDVDRVP